MKRKRTHPTVPRTGRSARAALKPRSLPITGRVASGAGGNALIEAMIEHLPNMVFLKDAENLRFVHFNKAGEELLGYSRFDLLDRNDYDFFPKEEADFFTAKDREVLASGRLLDIPEEPIQTRHKGLRFLHTRKIPICDASGRPQYLLGISEDITERKRVEQELKQAKEDLERRVDARTSELAAANAALQKEIVERETLVVSLQDMSARLIHAQEEERSRIARDLHDDFSQQLALIGIELEELGQQLPRTEEHLNALRDDLWGKVRQLSNDLHGMSHELHPSKLDHLGLPAALRSLCREISRLHGVTVQCVEKDVPASLPRSVGLCFYRIAQEALRNVVKHSHAQEALVEIIGSPGRIRMCVRDSGAGFDPELAAAKMGVGLISMRERVRGIGGHLTIRSQPLHGTSIDVQSPLTA